MMNAPLRLAPGTPVRALDRGNYGVVVEDYGDRVKVHFVSPDGHEATPVLPRGQIELTGGEDGPSPSSKARGPTDGEGGTAPPVPRGRDVYALSRVLAGLDVNDGEQDHLTDATRRMVDHLAALPLDGRDAAWQAMLAARGDGPALVEALAGIDPSGPPPEPEPEDALVYPRAANLGDVRAASDGMKWLWGGYIPAARLGGIAASEGVGKTRLALDLARRIWHGIPWPDGQTATLPPETPTLWICADGQQDEIADTAAAFGMPDGAILFNTPHDEPHGGNVIDATEDLERLESYIGMYRPGLVFVDTLTYATSFDLCRATDTKRAMTPLRDMAQRTGVTILPLMHLSREGQALGRRIKGLTRTLIHLECPDPEQPERLRLWVEKTSDKQAPALGVTMGDGGSEYDHNPPDRAEPGRTGGRPPEAREKAERFILAALARENDRIGNDLARECEAAKAGSRQTFWRAADALVERGVIVKDGGKGTGKQAVLHLIRPEADQAPASTPPIDPDAPF